MNSRDLGALDDFSKQEGEKKQGGDGTVATTAAKKTEEGVEGAAEWSDDFIKQAAAQFESNMAVLLGGDGGGQFTPEQLQQSFQKMAGTYLLICNFEVMYLSNCN